MTPDAHLDDYCQSMRRGLKEKLFFVPMLPRSVTAVGDYGCADGSLLRQAMVDMGWDRPRGVSGIGYDHDPRMVAKANSSPPDFRCNITESFGMFKAAFQQDRRAGRETVLVFSSVIHEFLSQPGNTHGDLAEIIETLDPDYVAIRDFGTLPALSAAEEADLEHCLKSAYPLNARAEAEERYFAFDHSTWVADCIVNGDAVLHYRNYLPRHIWQGIRERHGVWLETPTHVQILIKRNR